MQYFEHLTLGTISFAHGNLFSANNFGSEEHNSNRHDLLYTFDNPLICPLGFVGEFFVLFGGLSKNDGDDYCFEFILSDNLKTWHNWNGNLCCWNHDGHMEIQNLDESCYLVHDDGYMYQIEMHVNRIQFTRVMDEANVKKWSNMSCYAQCDNFYMIGHLDGEICIYTRFLDKRHLIQLDNCDPNYIDSMINQKRRKKSPVNRSPQIWDNLPTLTSSSMMNTATIHLDDDDGARLFQYQRKTTFKNPHRRVGFSVIKKAIALNDGGIIYLCNDGWAYYIQILSSPITQNYSILAETVLGHDFLSFDAFIPRTMMKSMTTTTIYAIKNVFTEHQFPMINGGGGGLVKTLYLMHWKVKDLTCANFSNFTKLPHQPTSLSGALVSFSTEHGCFVQYDLEKEEEKNHFGELLGFNLHCYFFTLDYFVFFDMNLINNNGSLWNQSYSDTLIHWFLLENKQVTTFNNKTDDILMIVCPKSIVCIGDDDIPKNKTIRVHLHVLEQRLKKLFNQQQTNNNVDNKCWDELLIDQKQIYMEKGYLTMIGDGDVNVLHLQYSFRAVFLFFKFIYGSYYGLDEEEIKFLSNNGQLWKQSMKISKLLKMDAYSSFLQMIKNSNDDGFSTIFKNHHQQQQHVVIDPSSIYTLDTYRTDFCKSFLLLDHLVGIGNDSWLLNNDGGWRTFQLADGRYVRYYFWMAAARLGYLPINLKNLNTVLDVFEKKLTEWSRQLLIFLPSSPLGGLRHNNIHSLIAQNNNNNQTTTTDRMKLFFDFLLGGKMNTFLFLDGLNTIFDILLSLECAVDNHLIEENTHCILLDGFVARNIDKKNVMQLLTLAIKRAKSGIDWMVESGVDWIGKCIEFLEGEKCDISLFGEFLENILIKSEKEEFEHLKKKQQHDDLLMLDRGGKKVGEKKKRKREDLIVEKCDSQLNNRMEKGGEKLSIKKHKRRKIVAEMADRTTNMRM